MILDSTTDALEIILDKAVTTEVSYATYYTTYTSTTVTPTASYGTTSGTSSVNLVPSPSANQQHQLKYCAINNVGSQEVGTKIRFNDNGSYRNVLYAYLRVSESIQYSEEMGWRVYTANGEEKVTGYNRIPSSIRMPEWFGAAGAATTFTSVNNTAYCIYLGRAERPYSSVKVQYRTTTALAGGGAWGELAIYRGVPTLRTGSIFTRLGYADASSSFTSTADVKTTTVPITSSIAIGDDLWAVFASSGSTATVYRAGVVDNLAAGFYQTSGSTRPSTVTSFTGSVDSTNAPIWMAWQGVYQGT